MSRKKILRMAGLGILVYVGMKYLLVPAIPFLLGWMLAYRLAPVTVWLEKRIHVKRAIAGAVLAGGLALLLALGLFFLVRILLGELSDLTHWLRGLTGYREQFLHQCCQITKQYTGIAYEDVYQFLAAQEEQVGQNLQRLVQTDGSSYLKEILTCVGWVASSALVTFLFTVLLIPEMEGIQKRIQEIPSIKMIWNVAGEIGMAGGRYLKTQGEIMLVVMAVCVFGLWLLGNPYFLLWGLLIGFLDALPVLGVGILLIPWVIFWFLQGNYGMAVGYLILFFAADLVRQFLEPKMIGKEVGIHPALMLISVYGGIFLYGVSGFFLGPLSVLIYIHIWRAWGSKTQNFKKN